MMMNSTKLLHSRASNSPWKTRECSASSNRSCYRSRIPALRWLQKLMIATIAMTIVTSRRRRHRKAHAASASKRSRWLGLINSFKDKNNLWESSIRTVNLTQMTSKTARQSYQVPTSQTVRFQEILISQKTKLDKNNNQKVPSSPH